jgi:hypothetical protein
MTSYSYEQACEIRSKVEKLTLTDLLSVNPTFRDMYYLNEVLTLGYGKGVHDIGDYTFEFAEKFLQKVGK